jgi:hypothetical protein
LAVCYTMRTIYCVAGMRTRRILVGDHGAAAAAAAVVQ